jgi:hypothetical protein
MPTTFMYHAMLVRLLGIGVPTNSLAITRLALINADVELRFLSAPL